MAKKKLYGSTLAEEKPLILTNIVYKNPLNCQSMQSKHTIHSMDTNHTVDSIIKNKFCDTIIKNKFCVNIIKLKFCDTM